MTMPLKDFITPFTNAKKPIDHKHFENIFEKDIWPSLTKLSGNSGIAHIELKTINPGDLIIKKGHFDMMIYWLTSGKINIVSEVNQKKTIINKYTTPGDCFGELGVIDESERTADVYASADTSVTLIEIDWSITNICRELDAKFSKLILKTVSKKLIDSYQNTMVAYSLIKTDKIFLSN